jgi:multidrug efflux pump subunit AcrA (membrane-fusion protein)
MKDEYHDNPYLGLSEDARNKIDRTFDKSQFDLNSSVLDVEIQDIALKLATLTTPISGIVTRVDAPHAGINITPASAEFDVVNPDTLYLSVTADQTEVIKLRAGMPATLTLDPFPSDMLEGTISAISFTPKSGETGTVYEVQVALPPSPSHGSYRLGMTGDATFVLSEKPDVLSVPSNYVKPEGEKKYVMRKNAKNEQVKQYIETGIETDTMTEVIGGISNGDVLYD